MQRKGKKKTFALGMKVRDAQLSGLLSLGEKEKRKKGKRKKDCSIGGEGA